MILISKNLYIDKKGDIVNRYSKTHHKAIKVKPINVKSRTNILFGIKNNNRDPRFKVGDHVRMSKYRTLQLD